MAKEKWRYMDNKRHDGEYVHGKLYGFEWQKEKKNEEEKIMDEPAQMDEMPCQMILFSCNI